MRKINFMLTAFRDGFQSVYGGRVFAKDYMPAVEAAKEAGISHFEAGGGAMFQSPFFYANENAYDNMDLFRATVGPEATLQTLARGVNVVGLDSQSSDIIELHAKTFKAHGITAIRNFDALNDVDNLVFSGKCIKDAGLRHEVVVTLMSLAPDWPNPSGVHTPGFYAGVLRRIMDAGIEFDSICFKDASGTAFPATAGETIRLARKLLGDDINICYHTHETAGASIACYMEAIRAGATTIDLSLAPVSGGSCAPDVASMWHALRGTDYTLDIDISRVMRAAEVFKDCMKDYFLPPEATAVDPRIPFAPMPGGALTTNTQMMRDTGILDKYEEVFRHMGECVARGGYGTSVTPVSQFYFQQAYNNTLLGPWEKFADGYGKMVLGYFGKTPVPPDPEIVALASRQMGLEPTTKSVLEINDADPKKGRKAAEEKLRAAALPITDENVFITAACGDKGITFLKGEARANVRKNVPPEPREPRDGPCDVTINGRTYTVRLQNGRATVNGKSYAYDVKPASASSLSGAPSVSAISAISAISGGPAIPGGTAEPVPSPLPGTVTRVIAGDGDVVGEDQVILVIEAMKMETEIRAPKAGAIRLMVKQGDPIQAGTVLAEVS